MYHDVFDNKLNNLYLLCHTCSFQCDTDYGTISLCTHEKKTLTVNSMWIMSGFNCGGWWLLIILLTILLTGEVISKYVRFCCMHLMKPFQKNMFTLLICTGLKFFLFMYPNELLFSIALYPHNIRELHTCLPILKIFLIQCSIWTSK